jgi:hypothetical protein
MTWRNSIILAGSIMSLSLAGCAYRLYPVSPASHHTLTVIAKSPDQYTIQIQSKHYPVAADGRVTFDYPAVRRGCGVYLFDRIPITRGADPLKEKTISVTNGINVLKLFSLDDVAKLPRDSSGFRVLNLNSR